MVSFPIKALIGAGVAGAVGLGGYGIHAFVSGNKTLADYLKSQGLVLLDVDGVTDDETWGTNVTSHESSDQTPKLSGYEKVDTADKDAKNKQSMKNACKKLLSALVKDKTKDMEDQAKKWCAKSVANG